MSQELQKESQKKQIKALEASVRVLREQAQADREEIRSLKSQVEQKDKLIADANAILELVDHMLPSDPHVSMRDRFNNKEEKLNVLSSILTVAARVARFRELLGSDREKCKIAQSRMDGLERALKSVQDERDILLTSRNEWRSKARGFRRELRINAKNNQK